MMRRVLDEIRTREGTITASCPFVVDYLSRTTTYADLAMPIWSTPVTRGYSDRAAAEAASANAGG
jgi:uncharacterized protein